MSEKKNYFRNQTLTVYASVKDEDGFVVPLTTVEHFSVTIKKPYANATDTPLNQGITGPIDYYRNLTGPSGPVRFFFTYVATDLGTYKYRIQYDSNTGPTGPFGVHFKSAHVGSFKVVDDDF